MLPWLKIVACACGDMCNYHWKLKFQHTPDAILSRCTTEAISKGESYSFEPAAWTSDENPDHRKTTCVNWRPTIRKRLDNEICQSGTHSICEPTTSRNKRVGFRFLLTSNTT